MPRPGEPNTPEALAKLSQSMIERHRRYREEYPAPRVGRKRCSMCEEWKTYNLDDPFVSDFSIVRRYRKDGEFSLHPKSNCRPCEVVRVRRYEIRVGRKKHGKRGKHRRMPKPERMPTAPFREWFEERVRPLFPSPEEMAVLKGEVTAGRAVDILTVDKIAEKVGIIGDTLRNYIDGRAKTMPREIVDRVGLLFGHMDLSDELYDDRLEESA